MRLWECRFGLILMTAAESQKEAEQKAATWMNENGALYGQWIVREVKDEGTASDCVGR